MYYPVIYEIGTYFCDSIPDYGKKREIQMAADIWFFY